MRYRMEVIGDELAIQNVETDLKLGTVLPFWTRHPDDPDQTVFACNVFNNNGDKLATISTATVSNPLKRAPVAVANYEAMAGYPGLKSVAKRPDPHRIEWLLGSLLADAVSVLARALIECRTSGLKSETKEKWGEMASQIYDIWYASRFGSFDADRRVMDPYFANGPYPRISFADAAQHYGMIELRMRFPDVDEARLREMLSWPLQLLTDLLNRLSPQ